MTDRAAYTQGLRALADWIDAHPELPLPSEGTRVSFPVHFHAPLLDRKKARALMSTFAHALPGKVDKEGDDTYFRLHGLVGGLHVEVTGYRKDVCERVVVGTHEETVEEPVETRTVTRTIEDVEWRCPPSLLGGAA